MSLTFGDAKKILAQYQGKGGKLPSDEYLDAFVIQVFQYLLISGSPDTEKVFDLYATDGWFTAPYDLETPLKIKINNTVGNVVSKWFEYRSASAFAQRGCYEAEGTLFEQANEFYTIYDPPVGGVYIGVQGTASECPDAKMIVQGIDPSGRDIFTNHKGADIHGELLSIVENTITWSNVKFGKITGIVKSRTKGYTPLYWRTDEGLKGFLSDYSPVDEVPSYRRFTINIKCPETVHVSVLGKIRIKPVYADNDRIPFDNHHTLQVAGQHVNSLYNNEMEAAIQRDNMVQSLVSREATHKATNNGKPLEVFYDNSAGTIQGIVGGSYNTFGFRRGRGSW